MYQLDEGTQLNTESYGARILYRGLRPFVFMAKTTDVCRDTVVSLKNTMEMLLTAGRAVRYDSKDESFTTP
jgi:hypothetical protein